MESKEEKSEEKHSVAIEDNEFREPDNVAQLVGQLQEKLEMSRKEIKQILQKL